MVIAHRGDNRNAPENTLPAFAQALRQGAELVELDYMQSADGVPVVFHDRELDRTTDAEQVLGDQKIPLSTKMLAELRRLDAGSWFDRKFSGTKIPTLEEALDLIQPRAVPCIEHKAGSADTLVKLLKRKDMLGQVAVMSFDWEFIAQCHRLAPRLVLVTLGDDQFDPQRLENMENAGARVVGWNQERIGPREIDAIHRHGLRAWVWTVNERQRARKLIDAGIDGIISDVPTMIQ